MNILKDSLNGWSSNISLIVPNAGLKLSKKLAFTVSGIHEIYVIFGKKDVDLDFSKGSKYP